MDIIHIFINYTAVIFHTTDLSKAVFKYGERAYRYLHLDAGHIGQRINLAAVNLNLGVSGISDVRIGKNIELCIEAENEVAAKEKADVAAKQLLANAVMEFYEIVIIA